MKRRSAPTEAPPRIDIVNDDSGVCGLRVEGPLTFVGVVALREQSRGLVEQVLERESGAEFDLAGVTRTDSAGLALLLHWMRVARKQGCTVRFANVPAQLLAIARTSGLDAHLPVTAA